MKRCIFSIIALSLLISSCDKSKRGMLVGAWKGVSMENPVDENFYKQNQHYLDTFGKGNSDIVNYNLYGVTNIDSLRKEMQAELDSTRALQMNGVKNSLFTFNKDSVAIMSFNGFIDTCKWLVNKDGALEIIEMAGKNKGERVTIDIMELTEKQLKLKFAQDSSFSTVTFQKSGK